MKNVLNYKNYIGMVEFSEEDKVFFRKGNRNNRFNFV